MDWLKEGELERFSLYNLETDPSQTVDLAETEPQRLDEMAQQMRAFWTEIKNDSPYWESWKMK
jgi:hypothetical protein